MPNDNLPAAVADQQPCECWIGRLCAIPVAILLFLMGVGLGCALLFSDSPAGIHIPGWQIAFGLFLSLGWICIVIGLIRYVCLGRISFPQGATAAATPQANPTSEDPR